MKFSRIGGCLAVFALLIVSGCGGGGGSAGTPNGGSLVSANGTVSAVSQETLLNLQLKDTGGAVTQSVAASGGAEIVATLTTKAGVPVAGQIIVFDDIAISLPISFPNGKSVTTDENGQAKLKVARISLTKFGSGPVIASSSSTASFKFALSSIDVRVDPPTLLLELFDASNAPTNSISSSALTTVRATLKFADGTPVMQKRVEIGGDVTKVSFPEGSSQLTDATGIATIKVARAALNVSGAGSLSGSAVISGADARGFVDTTAVAGGVDYQVGVANIALSRLNLGTGPLPAFGNRTVSVLANINGVAATSSPVQITFSASCGTTLPTTVTTNSEGIASTTYSASLATCAGSNVNITASAVGAPSVVGTIAVANSIATNIQFVSTTPQLIYLKGSTGTTQAQVVFKVLDSNGTPLQNQKVRLSLSNISTGVTLNTLGNAGSFDFATDSAGLVSAAVFSGTVPTSLNVTAVLLDSNNAKTSVFVNSNLLSVASGRPSQKSLSLSVEKLSIEGANTDGVTTNVTFSMADRQGNPVPPGTQVNFVTESGVFLPAACFVPPPIPATASSPAVPSSSCTVTLRSQGTRTLNGRVSILAYTAGEEDFVDNNGNNIFDTGDTFTDLGRAFRDDNAQARTGINGVYDSGEFQVPRLGAAACVNGGGCAGDGVWGEADVRRQGIVVFATSGAVISAVSQTGNNLVYTVADGNGNSVPTGSAIAVSSSSESCGFNSGASGIVANSLSPATFTARYSASISGPCPGGTVITVRVTSPLGLVSSGSFAVPLVSSVALSVLSGPTVSVTTGSERRTTVSGGTGPYSVSSSAVAVATVFISNSSLFITGVAAGTATVIVSDAAGAEFPITVTVN